LPDVKSGGSQSLGTPRSGGDFLILAQVTDSIAQGAYQNQAKNLKLDAQHTARSTAATVWQRSVYVMPSKVPSI